jgi:hypothetical protein
MKHASQLNINLFFKFILKYLYLVMTLSDKNNIDPDLWGPYFWNVIHLTSFGYPDNPNNLDKQSYLDFYLNLGKVLPCDSCSNSCISFMENPRCNLNDALNSRDSLIKWTYDLHNTVNEKLEKKYSQTFESFNKNYISNLNNSKIKYKIIIYLLVILIIILTVVLIIKR